MEKVILLFFITPDGNTKKSNTQDVRKVNLNIYEQKNITQSVDKGKEIKLQYKSTSASSLLN